jgi:hypothetical protein
MWLKLVAFFYLSYDESSPNLWRLRHSNSSLQIFTFLAEPGEAAKLFLAFFAALLCVLCGQKLFNRKDR